MVLYVIFGVVIGLLSVLSLLAARAARSVARTNGLILARLEEAVAELRRSVQQELASQSQAGARQSLELQTEMRSLADLHQQEFSRVRALIEVVPHSVAALKPELAQIRANLPPPKPAYEDPVPFIEAMSEADVLRIAAALALSVHLHLILTGISTRTGRIRILVTGSGGAYGLISAAGRLRPLWTFPGTAVSSCGSISGTT